MLKVTESPGPGPGMVAARANPPRCISCQAPFDEFWEILQAAPRLALRQAEGPCPDCRNQSAKRSGSG